MQLQTLGKGRFEAQWSEDKHLIEQTIRDCICTRRIFDENEKLLTQGEHVENLYLVDSGRISMGVTARNGKTFLLGTLECEQQVFGEMEFFTGYRCQMDIVPVEPVDVAIIDAQKLQRCLLEKPRLSLYFASAIAIDYQDTVEILAPITLPDHLQRGVRHLPSVLKRFACRWFPKELSGSGAICHLRPSVSPRSKRA